ncbi:MAG: GNAT family N-acetyltransferase [Atopobiaceae bacterium]|nr:GNAT family N-acetyltransferase [Atopobiaceae bacterium]
MDRTASDFFDEDGIVATTARLVLRRPVRDDLLAYIDTFSEGLRKEYLRSDASGDSLRRGYWDDVSSEGSLFCTITASKDRRTCGFCCIEQLEEDPSEIGIRLLPEFRGRGIGGEAVSALIAGVERMAGPTEFVAQIDADNEASQRLFRRLGFLPDHVDTPIFKDPTLIAWLEESRLNLIDDRLRALADEFGVEPRTLLSHSLVFKRPVTEGLFAVSSG